MKNDIIYMIFRKNDENSVHIYKYDLLNFTNDYFYFKRLMKKYVSNNEKVYGRKIRVQKLLENSTAARL